MKKKLGKELWRRIESAQGYAFISDLIEELPDDKIVPIAKLALINAKKVVRILESFIAKYEVKNEA